MGRKVQKQIAALLFGKIFSESFALKVSIVKVIFNQFVLIF